MKTNKQIDLGGYQAETTEEWSPYHPFDFKSEKDVLTLNAPKTCDIGKWYYTTILGYGGMDVPKYLKQDVEILKDSLENLLIHKDEITFLNWIYRITKYIGDTSKEFVMQMPEDFIKAFLKNESRHLDRVDDWLLAGANVVIAPIHDNIYIPAEPSKEAYQTFPVCSLKMLAIWLLKILEMIHGCYDSEQEFECTFNELCQAYRAYQNYYWEHMKEVVDIGPIPITEYRLNEVDSYELTKYLNTGHICTAMIKYVSVDCFECALDSIYQKDYTRQTDKQNPTN